MVAKSTASKRVSSKEKKVVVTAKKDLPVKTKIAKETKKPVQKKAVQKKASTPTPTPTPTPTSSSKKEKKHVDEPLVNKAVTALLKHHENQNKDSKALLGTDTTVQVQIGLEIAPVSPSPKPVRIMIPHPILKLDGGSNGGNDKMDVDNDNNDGDDTGLEEPEVCLIVKEESKEWVTAMIAQFPDHMGCIKKVLGLQSLRTKHAQFNQRRALMHKYTHFMADDRILPMLTKALGKNFMKAKKQPIPIALTRKEALPFSIHKALSATFMTLKEGTCVTIRAGNTGMPAAKLVANVTAITEHAIAKLPRKWANVRSIAIKTAESVSLPIYNKTPEELVEIGKRAGLKSVWKEAAQQTSTSSTTEEEDEEELAAKDEKKRKADKLAAKSPLVRALKKQKQKEEVPTKVVPVVEEFKETKKKVAVKETTPKKVTKETTPKKATKETTPKKAEAKDATARPTRSAVKKTRERSDAGEEKESPVKKAKIQDEPKSSHKMEKRIKSSEVAEKKEVKKVEKSPKKEPKKKAEKEVKKVDKEEKKVEKSFIASKKYSGSRKGFVFKAGTDGVGYYKDVKPVVDKAALEAIARMGGRSKGTKSPKGGKRRSR